MKKDIRVDTAFPGHRKTRRLKRDLGEAGPAYLLALWCYAGEYRRDGVLSGMTPADIADAALYQGDPETFVQTLLDIRWLDCLENGALKIHEWEEHQPYLATEDIRRAKAKITAEIGWLKRKGLWNEKEHAYLVEQLRALNAGRNAQPMRDACRTHAGRMQDACTTHAQRMQDACTTHAQRMRDALHAHSGTHAQRMQEAMRKACRTHRTAIAPGLVHCDVACAFFICSDAPYPYPTPHPYRFPIYTPENFSGEGGAKPRVGKKSSNPRTAPELDYGKEIAASLESFGELKVHVLNYLKRISLNNKSQRMALSRQLTYILELKAIREEVVNDTHFLHALKVVTDKGVETLNYMREVIKNLKRGGGDGGTGGSTSNRLLPAPGKYAGIGTTVDTRSEGLFKVSG